MCLYGGTQDIWSWAGMVTMIDICIPFRLPTGREATRRRSFFTTQDHESKELAIRQRRARGRQWRSTDGARPAFGREDHGSFRGPFPDGLEKAIAYIEETILGSNMKSWKRCRRRSRGGRRRCYAIVDLPRRIYLVTPRARPPTGR